MYYFSLLLALLISSAAWAQDCTTHDDQVILTEEGITGVVAGFEDKASCMDEELLVPDTVHWHIYTTSDDETPKVSMTPKGIVEPFVDGGELKFRLGEGALANYTKGDSIQAGVSIFVKASLLETIEMTGVDEVVELIHNGTQPLTIRSSGVDNRLHITSPNAAVTFRGAGVDNFAQIEAGPDSSIHLSGIDSTVEIFVPDEDLTVVSSGVDSSVFVVGNYREITSTGVDAKILVNGETGCDNFFATGIDNSCALTTKTVTVEEVACLADTKVVQQDWNCFFANRSTRIAVGVGSTILIVAILGLCIYGCCKCCDCCCCGGGTTPKQKSIDSRRMQIDEEEPAVYAQAQVTGIDKQKFVNSGNVTTAVELHSVVIQ